ncbi:DinB family protein [Paenibacillus sp. JX-17]|uniref:DinB family protein n=1 Tax=Paenibacillus lacisoli TaxID=3064525 RepID=A0ABT9CE13_9BACL|nr:DinB family protein [Paenibacillus sp. JX-17]MDO7907505.1 DinB family protein [Paenibacillus sp. JX-17]
MSDQFNIALMGKSRQSMLKAAESLTEEQRTMVPAGFNNSIHWQLGHVVAVAESILYGFGGQPSELPKEYAAFFGPGTKPADWTGQPPAWEDVVSRLQQQVVHARETFGSRMDSAVAVKENFAKAETIQNLFELVAYHDGSHEGMVKAMARIVQQ